MTHWPYKTWIIWDFTHHWGIPHWDIFFPEKKNQPKKHTVLEFCVQTKWRSSLSTNKLRMMSSLVPVNQGPNIHSKLGRSQYWVTRMKQAGYLLWHICFFLTLFCKRRRTRKLFLRFRKSLRSFFQKRALTSLRSPQEIMSFSAIVFPSPYGIRWFLGRRKPFPYVQ